MKCIVLSIAALVALVTAGGADAALSSFTCEPTAPLEEKKSCEWSLHYHGSLQQVAPRTEMPGATQSELEGSLRIGHPVGEVSQAPVHAGGPAFAILASHLLVGVDRYSEYEVVVGLSEIMNRWVVSTIVFRRDGTIMDAPLELEFDRPSDEADEPRATIQFGIALTGQPFATQLAIQLRRSGDGVGATHSFMLEPGVRLASRTLGPILDSMMPQDSEVSVHYFEF